MHVSRAEQRKQRLIEAEMEQAAEEVEAPCHTLEQRQLLMQPFATVKAEFADLDGLRWTQTAQCKLQIRANGTAHTTTNSNSNTFIVLTNTGLASFSVDDTIRRPTTTTTTKSEELVSHRDAPSPPSSTSSSGSGSISTSISTSSLTLASTSTLPFPSSVTATPPFSPAPTLASPASGFHLRSGRALNADAAHDSDAGAALDDANANSDEEEEEEDTLSLSLLLPSPPSPSLSAPSLRECRSPAITLTPLSYAHMVASAAYDMLCILKKAWMSQRQRRSPYRLYTPCTPYIPMQ
ncbi:hypothetical protein CVT25_014032 [Psilocybe cyanescens]|uniref:Uncharacterized protein n=1 Tax=Psilocybe cyanescens TaxID=93625 RepID=A0A409XJZ4_PSICY|nr:hypothetical protein CVT25_014032 [Psilocybe cyanescens]